MFQDVTVSGNLVEGYSTYCRDKCLTDIGKIYLEFDYSFKNFYLVDFSCLVLTSNAWPFTIPTTFNLPNEVKFSEKKPISILFLFLFS